MRCVPIARPVFSGGRRVDFVPRRPRWDAGQFPGHEGFALLEVVLAGLILGVAVIGVSLLLQHAETAVIGQGDRYVALYLAHQKVEKIVALNVQRGFGYIQTGDSTLTTGCGTDPDREPCYSETVEGGEQVGASSQSFTRTTCVNFVNDDDPATPSGCTSCMLGGTCTNNTKRITVTVAPGALLADPVTLVTVITNHPSNN
jgi:hypothetical protein